MSPDPLTPDYKQMIQDYVHELCDSRRSLADVLRELAFDGCFHGWGDCNNMRQQMAPGLCAHQWFHQQKPKWAPELPLGPKHCAVMKWVGDARINLVGWFGDSLRHSRWQYQLHPDFQTYSRGDMAFLGTPAEIRTDRRLLAEFPPWPIECSHQGGFVLLPTDPAPGRSGLIDLTGE